MEWDCFGFFPFFFVPIYSHCVTERIPDVTEIICGESELFYELTHSK